MSVRRRRWRDSFGALHEGWMVDVQGIGKDGRLRRVRKIAPMQTRRAAEKLEHETRAELMRADGRAVTTATEGPLFAAFAEQFVSTYAVTNNKHAEVISKRKILRVHLVPAFGDLRLDQVGLAEIEAYKADKLTAGLAKKTINNHLTVLRKLLSTAVEWRLLALVPPIKWLKAPAGEFDFLTFEEADRLIAGAEDEWRAMITVALRTGLRHGELIGLRWTDVDLDAGRLIIRQAVSEGVIGTPKNGRTREVPLCKQALDALRDRPRNDQYVFCAPDGSILTHAQTRWPLKRALKNAGLRHIGWHSLRHSFASHLVMRGAPIKSVQELLGRSSIEMTMRYAHLSSDVRRDAVKLLDVRETVRLTWTTSRGVLLQIAMPQPPGRHDRVHGTRLGQGDGRKSPVARRVRWARTQGASVRSPQASPASSRHIRGTWNRPLNESPKFFDLN